MTGLLIRRDKDTDTHKGDPCVNTGRGHLQAKKRGPQGSQDCDISTVNNKPSGCEEILLSQPLGLWYLVMATGKPPHLVK